MQILKRISRWGLMIVLLAGHTSLCAQKTVAVEQLKAVFLFNFTRFVEWPADAFKSDTDPFIIGVAGANPFGTYMEEVSAGEKVNGHPIIVRYCKTNEDIKTCNLLFINKTNTSGLSEVLAETKGKSILTVGDASDFLQEGGMVRFYINSNNKVQLQMNAEAAKAARLQVSSKLLRLTEQYREK